MEAYVLRHLFAKTFFVLPLRPTRETLASGGNMLFDDEQIALQEEPERTPNLSDSEINDKYSRGEVRIVTEQARYPLNTIVGMVESSNYILNPEFQRRHRWDKVKKSRLIESFIMNVPLPPIFLYEFEFSKYEVMDGLQRLTAIKEFYKDEFQLEGLDEWPELNGKIYSALPERVRQGIDRRYLSSIILLQETAKDEEEATRLKQLVFDRINSGGVKLASQESRNAIYNGPMNRMCIKLSRDKHLCRAWGIPEPTDKEVSEKELEPSLITNEDFMEMKDVELVLRFFANRQRHRFSNMAVHKYFDHYLCKANEFNPSVMQSLELLFLDTIKFVYELFGERSFHVGRKVHGKWYWYGKATPVVYDPLMHVCSEMPKESRTALLERADDVRYGIEDFYKNNYEEFKGNSYKWSDIKRKSELYKQFFSKYEH